MKTIRKLSLLSLSALTMMTLQFWGVAQAQSGYFTSRGCADCHTPPVVATCNGCHGHGAHASSAKTSVNITGVTNKTSYAPGETVTVTINGGYRGGWVRAVLYNQSNVELARSTGNASGMGSATTFPATLTAAAPTTPGTYTWKAAWYGHRNDAAGAAFGPGWTPDPGNPDHGSEIVNTNSFTVASAAPPADTTPPSITAFKMPGTSNSLTVPVSALTASDNVAVTGYLITTSATRPAANAPGWTATVPTSVTAPAPGSTTFYAWAKDAAGNVSTAGTATVVVTLPDTSPPTISAFRLPTTATSLTIPITTFTATDNVGVTGYMVTNTANAPAASATGWSATAPTSVTASAAGAVVFYGWAKDAAGNVSAAAAAPVTITLPDSTPPVISSFKMPATSTSLTVPVTTLIAADNVAVTGYLITENATAPAVSSAGWTASAPGSVTASGAGSKTFYAWAKDAAGNVSASAIATVSITAPSTGVTLSLSTLPDGSYTNNATLNISGSASSPVGLKGITVNGNPVTAMPNGSFTTALTLVPGANNVTVVATDAAGTQKTSNFTVYYDPVAPLLTISAPADNSETVKSFINVTGTIDETSTVTLNVNNGSPQSANVTGNSFNATVNLVAGVNTINITATDLAGNTSKAKRTVTYDYKKLSLAVTHPSQDITTRHSVIPIIGTVTNASKEITVKIAMDGKTYYTPKVKDDTFRQQVKFTEAKLYAITITATDTSGNTSTVTRNVIYRPKKERKKEKQGRDEQKGEREKEERGDREKED